MPHHESHIRNEAIPRISYHREGQILRPNFGADGGAHFGGGLMAVLLRVEHRALDPLAHEQRHLFLIIGPEVRTQRKPNAVTGDLGHRDEHEAMPMRQDRHRKTDAATIAGTGSS